MASMACPSCYSTHHRQLASGLYECTTPPRLVGQRLIDVVPAGNSGPNPVPLYEDVYDRCPRYTAEEGRCAHRDAVQRAEAARQDQAVERRVAAERARRKSERQRHLLAQLTGALSDHCRDRIDRRELASRTCAALAAHGEPPCGDAAVIRDLLDKYARDQFDRQYLRAALAKLANSPQRATPTERAEVARLAGLIDDYRRRLIDSEELFDRTLGSAERPNDPGGTLASLTELLTDHWRGTIGRDELLARAALSVTG